MNIKRISENVARARTLAISSWIRRVPRHIATAGLAIAGGTLSIPSVATGAAPDQDSYARGRILVMPRPGLSDAEFGKILGVHGGKARKLGGTGVYIVDLPGSASEKAIAHMLAAHPQLKFAELDRRVAPSFAANDPYLGSEWHIAQIGASTAWNIATGTGVTIAILDSGVDGTHPDLAAQMATGWNFYDNNSNTADVYGHGTVVAGGAAAQSNNGLGVASVAGSAKIMPIRVTDTTGYGYWSLVAQGLTYAADHGARVANVSFDGVAGSSTVQAAAQYMKGKGGLVVVAAGNSGINENIPQSTTMIPVSATDSTDSVTSWSSYGSYVAMSAPGVGIWSTGMGGTYGAYSGTSISSPLVAGTVALMMSANPALANTKVESLLYSTAIDLGTPGRDIYYGYGRVNAAGAVQAAAGAVGSIDLQPPTVAIAAPFANSTVGGLVPVNVTAADNVGVSKVVLTVNGATIATDTFPPFSLSWDSKTMTNGMATLIATAYDSAGNFAASPPIAVNVANSSSTVTPSLAVSISSPNAGQVSGTVQVISSASDINTATISQTIYIDGAMKASGSGTSLSYSWNTRKYASGTHTILVKAVDSLGNISSSSIQVTK